MPDAKLDARLFLTGIAFSCATFLFFVALVLMSIFGYTIPNSSRTLLCVVLAFGAGLSSSLLGGRAVARGDIAIPIIGRNPIYLSITGGIAVFVISFFLGYYAFSGSDEPPVGGNAGIFDGYKDADRSGFRFYNGTNVSWNSGQADILAAAPPGEGTQSDLQLFLPYDVPPYNNDALDRGSRSGIRESRAHNLRELKECPPDGYQYHWHYIEERSVYCIRLRNGSQYAAIYIEKILPDRIMFDWKMSRDGSSAIN